VHSNANLDAVERRKISSPPGIEPRKVRVQVLTAVSSTKMAVFCCVALCNPVKIYPHSSCAYCIALMMEAVRTSETSVSFYETT
jgi:hypothetical protein